MWMMMGRAKNIMATRAFDGCDSGRWRGECIAAKIVELGEEEDRSPKPYEVD